jgi:hypothetical protein
MGIRPTWLVRWSETTTASMSAPIVSAMPSSTDMGGEVTPKLSISYQPLAVSVEK